MAILYPVLLLLLAGTSFAQTNETIVCDGVVFNDQYYDKEVLFKDFGMSYNLAVLEPDEQLFFSHAVINDSYSFKHIKFCGLKDKICDVVNGIVGGNAVFKYAKRNELYFGGYNGIYLYNAQNKTAEILVEKNKPVWGLFINVHKFYYITYPGKKLQVFSDKAFKRVAEVEDVEVENFYITKHSVLYFSNCTGLYRVEKPQIPFSPIVLIKDKVLVRQISEDIYGNAFFAMSDGVYIDDMVSGTVRKLADIPDLYSILLLPTGVYSVAVIYSDKDAINGLIESKHGDYCYNLIQNKTESQGENESVSVNVTVSNK